MNPASWSSILAEAVGRVGQDVRDLLRRPVHRHPPDERLAVHRRRMRLREGHVLLVDPDRPTEPERPVDQQVDLRDVGAAQSPRVVEDGVEDLLLGGRGAREDRQHLDDRRQLRPGAGLGVEQHRRLAGLGAGVVVHVGLPVTGSAIAACPRA